MTRSFLHIRSGSDSPTGSRRRRPGGFALGAVAAVAIAGTLTASAAPPGVGQPANVVPLAPARILDTRTGTGAPQARVGAGQTITLKVAGAGGVPANATGVILNLTVAGPSDGGFVTAWPTGEPRPNASVINFQGGWDIANMVTATLGSNGSIDLYNDRGSVDLIADVAGYLSSVGGGTKSVLNNVPTGQTATLAGFAPITATAACSATDLLVTLTAPTGTTVTAWGQTTATNPSFTGISRVTDAPAVPLIGAAKGADGARWSGIVSTGATVFDLDLEIQYSTTAGCVVRALVSQATPA